MCHDDVNEGAAVTVYDATTKIVATGALAQGSNTALGGCEFPLGAPRPDSRRKVGPDTTKAPCSCWSGGLHEWWAILGLNQ